MASELHYPSADEWAEHVSINAGPGDAARLAASLSRLGYRVDPRDASAAWTEFSESLSAEWLILAEDDAGLDRVVRENVLRYLEPCHAG